MENNKLLLLSIKDIQNKLGISRSTAQRYYSDLKKHFDVHKPLYCHFESYFKIV